jgi:hypothetical protein
MRRFVLTLLFALLVITLNRDETWALPRLSDQILTEADLEEIIDQNRFGPILVRKIVPICECDSPSNRLTPLRSISESDELTPLRTISEADDCDCASGKQVEWICGTMALKAEAAIRKAIESGLHPWAVAQLVEQNCGLLGTCRFGL